MHNSPFYPAGLPAGVSGSHRGSYWEPEVTNCTRTMVTDSPESSSGDEYLLSEYGQYFVLVESELPLFRELVSDMARRQVNSALDVVVTRVSGIDSLEPDTDDELMNLAAKREILLAKKNEMENDERV